MRQIFLLLKRFRSDESGAFAVLFGVMAIVLVALGGAVVDFVSVQQARTRAQVALDAAALALQPRIFDNPTPTAETLRVAAQNLLLERVDDASTGAKVDEAVIDIDNGSLRLRASLNVPMSFVRLVGVNAMPANLLAEATRKKLKLEVAMVLDNSGSMLQYDRMDYLKEAAACATNILFMGMGSPDKCTPPAGATVLEDVTIGLVPFTMYVNVGASNAGAAWIDANGLSSISNDNFDNDDNDATVFNGVVKRLALYDAITNENWRGCVEARPHTASATGHYDTDDTTPDTARPDTLFVPLFAPDTPSWGQLNYTGDSPASCDVLVGACQERQVYSMCDSSSARSGCSSNLTQGYRLTHPNGTVTTANGICNCTDGHDSGVSSWSSFTVTKVQNTPARWDHVRTRTCTDYFRPVGLSNREYQERLCKYTGALSNLGGQRGPNADCPRAAILPLTNDVDDVQDAIEAMIADGGTNIHEGTAWGLRALSPTTPFTEGAAYDDDETAKVMIVMTDGENTAYASPDCSGTAITVNGSCFFSAYGFPYNSRLGVLGNTSNVLEAEMDARLVETCENAKDEGIQIYTIGLSSPEDRKDTLEECATSAEYAFFPDDPQDLEDVFVSIAEQLAALRLAR